MTGLKEYIFIISILNLHVAGFLQFGGGNSLLSGDNFILIVGLVIIFTSKELHSIRLSSITRTAFSFGVILILVIPFYIFIKGHDYIGSVPTEVFSFVKMIPRLVLVYYFVKYLTLSYRKFRNGILSILMMGVVITLSMIYMPIFETLGFYVYKIGKLYNTDDLFRFSGITAMSVNVAGVLFAMLIGITLDFYKKGFIKSIQSLFFITLFLLAVLLTGSRTALGITAIIFIMFILINLHNLNLREKIVIILLIFAAIIISINFVTTTLYRAERYSNVEYMGLGYRIGYWLIYFSDLMKNPEYFLYGNTAPASYSRSPHNFYVYTTFSAGLFFLVLPFIYLRRFFIQREYLIKKKGSRTLNSAYILVPQLIFWVTANEPITWFGLILLMATTIELDNNKRNNITNCR